MLNKILTSANAALGVTNLSATTATVTTQDGLPLGTPGDSATGPLAVKTLIVGSIGGTYTSGAVTGVTATTTTGVALAANAARKNAVIVNYGATNGAFLAVGVPAESGKGIYLAPNGGSYEINSTNLTLGAINCITASSTTTLSVSEGT